MIRSLYAGPIALAALMLPAAALAAPAASNAISPLARPTAVAAPFGAALDDATMSKTTARADTSMIAQSQQTSSVSNNTITGNSTTGDVNIENAFQNASGMVLINANSGNNVSMNGSMNVNIIMTGPSPQH